MRNPHCVPLSGLLALAVLAGPARAQHGGHGSLGLAFPAHHGPGGIGIPLAVGGGYGAWMPYYPMGTPGGLLWYGPSPGAFMGPGGGDSHGRAWWWISRDGGPRPARSTPTSRAG